MTKELFFMPICKARTIVAFAKELDNSLHRIRNEISMTLCFASYRAISCFWFETLQTTRRKTITTGLAAIRIPTCNTARLICRKHRAAWLVLSNKLSCRHFSSHWSKPLTWLMKKLASERRLLLKKILMYVHTMTTTNKNFFNYSPTSSSIIIMMMISISSSSWWWWLNLINPKNYQ